MEKWVWRCRELKKLVDRILGKTCDIDVGKMRFSHEKAGCEGSG